MREASYYERGDAGKVACQLCPHLCRIGPEGAGKCRVRRNEEGRLVTLNYGRVTSVALDPIEKKPLYHFYPGSVILSMGTWGCNFRCAFCQNWEISQMEATTEALTPEAGAKLAGMRGSIGIAYTYNEPTVWFEHVLETAKLVHEAGRVNVLVTNGFIRREPLDELLEVVDALNIDIKSMSDEFYRKHTGGRLGPVLETAARAKERAHVEVTNLVIPGLNDRDEDFEALGQWVKGHMGEETPCHLSAYFPRFQMTEPATPISVMERAYGVVKGFLKHVYLGNCGTKVGRDTVCEACGRVLIRRRGYSVDASGMTGGQCSGCGCEVTGRYSGAHGHDVNG